jgi:hypothetical protein
MQFVVGQDTCVSGSSNTSTTGASLPRESRGLLARFKSWGDLLAAGALIVFVAYCVAAKPVVRFDRERIEVWALPGQIQVSGLYHYRNPLPLPALVNLGLPFPIDANHGVPTTFSISESDASGAAGTPIRPTRRNRDVSFRLLFRPGEEKWLRVDYVQGSRVPRGSYILLTTRAWGRALDRGDYVLHLAEGSALVDSNYSLAASAAPNTYRFSEENFYPDKDWQFEWGNGKPDGAGGRR